MWPFIKCLALLGSTLSILPSALAMPEGEPYIYTGDISFDIANIPFSRYGSDIVFSELTLDNLAQFAGAGVSPGVYLRSVHGDQHLVFRVELLDSDKPISFHVEATPSLLRLQAARGTIEICIPESDRVRFRGHGVSLRLIAQIGALAVPSRNGYWEVNSESPKEKYMLWATRGQLNMDAPWDGTSNVHVVATYSPDPKDLRVEGEIDTYPSVWTPHQTSESFEESVRSVVRDYLHWLKHMPTVPQSLAPGAELAAYVDWVSIVKPDGFFHEPAMLMSKNWMSAVWSWDHCFNAMALSLSDRDLARQQYMLPFDQQQPNGALPDMIHGSSIETNFTKPPIHGWALAWMMRHGGYNDRAHLDKIYGPLSLWTNWFFEYRYSDRDGLPEYYHGYDSGWDNSTALLSGVPIETPDLASFLILQMDTLADIAGRLGRDAEKRNWQQRSNDLLGRMLAVLWKGDHFIGIRSPDGAKIDSESLLFYLPIILGKRLPSSVRVKLVQGLTENGMFLTPHGFATEALTSKYYTPDGYWRGPIWPPTTMLLVEGLDSAGEHSLAMRLREEFCRMVQQNGMSENFDAITGKGLRDPAYTWTSSVYLILAHQLLGKPSSSLELSRKGLQ